MIEAYPEFAELYREVFDFRYHKKELVSMYSEALRILDQNKTPTAPHGTGGEKRRRI